MNQEQTSTFPPALRTRGSELLDHQCWALGGDILRMGGNLIMDYGFAKVQCPRGGLSQYELRNVLGQNSHVFLWGFSSFFGSEREGIFLARKGFTPFRTQGYVELHDRDNHRYEEESSNTDLLLKGIAWFADYEDWVSHRLGQAYRPETLKAFPRFTLLDCDFAAKWRHLARDIDQANAIPATPSKAPLPDHHRFGC